MRAKDFEPCLVDVVVNVVVCDQLVHQLRQDDRAQHRVLVIIRNVAVNHVTLLPLGVKLQPVYLMLEKKIQKTKL